MSDSNRFNLDDEEGQAMGAADEAAQHEEGGEEADYASAERFEQDKVRLVDFLQYPKDKRKLSDFLQETYKKYEAESVDRTINRVIHEHESESRGSTPFYKPGHIGPLMYEYLNMMGVEAAFVSGLQHTKASMVKTVQQKVDEINTLLRGVGGFNRQIKASFSRSAVVYLEKEDPDNKHRETVQFTVNLGDFELRFPLDESAEDQTVEDGRSLRRMVWDEAVNTLAEIVSNTGMKPKFVKNDKNSCVFTMRQYLLSKGEREPDELFTFDLRHWNEDAREKQIREYTSEIQSFEERIAELRERAARWFASRAQREELQAQALDLERRRDHYIGTHPDPREMDTGLIFSIRVNTLKDYGITKDKMQVIMTKFILALSRIAVDKPLDQQVSTVYQRGQSKPKDFQSLIRDAQGGEGKGDEKVVVMKDDLMRKKKAAGGRFGG
jgi:hypothetical protein